MNVVPRLPTQTAFVLRALAALMLALSSMWAISARAQTAAVSVSVVTPEAVTVTEELRLTGTLTAERHARLSTRADGLVADIHVDAGDRVAAGDVLLDLDAALATHAQRRAEASVEEARARVAESERLIEEARRLVADQHIPQTEVASREANVALARAALAASEAAAAEQAEIVRRHALPAPFGGVIARRLTEIGEWVVRGTAVLELVSTDTVWLDVQAPQERFARIDEAAPVEVLVDALAGSALTGRIIARVPVSDPAARTFLIRILVEGPELELLPGTSATAVIPLAGGRPALAVPRNALLRYPDGSHSLFVVSSADGESTAHERRVTIGGGVNEVAILQGLEPGERVVVRGNDSLRDGQRVQVGADS